MSLLSNVRMARRRVGLMFAVFLASAMGACRTDISGPDGRILIDTRGRGRSYYRGNSGNSGNRGGDGDDDDDD